jgi:hypothetical protein
MIRLPTIRERRLELAGYDTRVRGSCRHIEQPERLTELLNEFPSQLARAA